MVGPFMLQKTLSVALFTDFFTPNVSISWTVLSI